MLYRAQCALYWSSDLLACSVPFALYILAVTWGSLKLIFDVNVGDNVDIDNKGRVQLTIQFTSESSYAPSSTSCSLFHLFHFSSSPSRCATTQSELSHARLMSRLHVWAH